MKNIHHKRMDSRAQVGDKMKYGMVHADINTIYHNKNRYTPPNCTGLFNWLHAMDGEMYTIRDIAPGQLDVAQVNVCKATLDYPQRLKAIDKDLIIVANLDYDLDMLPQYGGYKPYIKCMNSADYVMVSTHAQRRGIGHLINKPLSVIPHPVDIEGLREFQQKKEDRNGVALLPHIKYGQPPSLGGILRGFVPPDVDVHCFYAMGEVDPSDYQFMYSALDYRSFVEILARRLVGVDLHRDLAYGRFQLDCAALGVPCVGPSNVESQCFLFPELVVGDHGDFVSMGGAVQQLLRDDTFFGEVCRGAGERLLFYGFENSRKRFLGMVEGKEEDENVSG